MSRITVPKTYKLYINGKFPRTESGRSTVVKNQKGEIAAHICRASRKDLRVAVESAQHAHEVWTNNSTYLKGQILFRMAEMLEARREEFAAAIQVTSKSTISQARKEVDASVDSIVSFAGWTDKIHQLLGCANSVNGEYYNFTIPQSQGVVAVITPQSPSLLAFISMICAPLCAGNTVVVIGSNAHPLPTAIFGEICQTSDVPAGVINVLTGFNHELLEHVATHRGIACVYSSGLNKKERVLLEQSGSDSMKRIKYLELDTSDWHDLTKTASPWNIEPFVEMKTIWHPSAC